MLRSEAVANIQRRLGYRSDKASEILTELIEAQKRLEDGGVQVALGGGQPFVFRPWFLVQEMATATTDPTDERIPVPEADPDGSGRGRFLEEYDPDALWYFDGTATEPAKKWTVMVKDDTEYLRGAYSTPGSPKAYTLSGGYFRIAPISDVPYTVKIIYYGTDAVTEPLVGDTNLWFTYAPFLLIGEAGRMTATNLRDAGAKASFEADVVREAMKLYSANEARVHANRRYVMGGDN